MFIKVTRNECRTCRTIQKIWINNCSCLRPVTFFMKLYILVHSSPKERQLSRGCLSFEEECRSVNFWPNVISTMLLVTICKKTPFQNSSQFTHSGKTSEYKSLLKFHETWFLKQVWKLPFFLGRVYDRKSGLIQHFHEFSWQ